MAPVKIIGFANKIIIIIIIITSEHFSVFNFIQELIVIAVVNLIIKKKNFNAKIKCPFIVLLYSIWWLWQISAGGV
jgi:hypothetical protein